MMSNITGQQAESSVYDNVKTTVRKAIGVN